MGVVKGVKGVRQIMTSKTIEIRDRCTFIPALAVKLNPVDERDRWLLARAGFGLLEEAQSQYILLTRLTDAETHYDPSDWTNRTMATAHLHLLEHFDDTENGGVIDVEYILGESKTPKTSEQNL
jgi:hypothetical protein